MKMALHEAAYGPWEGTVASLHLCYPTVHAHCDVEADDLFRFCIVRDPLERFVSAYRNRVLDQEALLDLEDMSLEQRPTLEKFALNLEAYREASYLIRHHTDPQTAFLGEDATRFHLMLRFYDLSEMVDIAGINLRLGHWMRSVSPGGEITRSVREKVWDFYHSDYALFGEI